MNDTVDSNKGLVEAVNVITRKKTFKLSGEREVEVRLCKVRDIATFSDFMHSIYGDLQLTGESARTDNLEVSIRDRLQDPAFILKLISNRGPEVWTILSLFSSLSVVDIEDLDLDDAILLVQQVVEVNYDFFTKRVLPVLRAALAAKMAISAG